MQTQDASINVFDRLDKWRHLPNYQLERRSDIFFSLYLPEIISSRYRVEVNNIIVPEMPLRRGTLFPEQEQNQKNKSVKVDYFMLSVDGTKGFLVELKTDQASRRGTQDKYLRIAKNIGLPGILDGLKEIFKATSARGKYFYLFRLLENLGLVTLPADLRAALNKSRPRNIGRLINDIEISSLDPELNIVYLQPTGDDSDVVNFAFVATLLRDIGDPLSLRFADSLDEWATVMPGEIGV